MSSTMSSTTSTESSAFAAAAAAADKALSSRAIHRLEKSSSPVSTTAILDDDDDENIHASVPEEEAADDDDEGPVAEDENTPYRLKLTNLALTKEIRQLKTDKEFVWSLWKRLQVANPDIPAAMQLVVTREREKAEIKDEKVLKILTIKDKSIADLEAERAALEEELAAKMAENVDVVAAMEERERRSMAETNESKEKLEKLTSEKTDLETANAASRAETSAKEVIIEDQRRAFLVEKTTLTEERDERRTVADRMTRRCEALEKEKAEFRVGLKEAEEREKTIGAKYADAKNLLRAINGQREKDKDLLEHKGKELESVRQELVNLWDKHEAEVEKRKSLQSIVTQLQTLQANTQNVIKNQEVVFETDANNLKANFGNLKDEMKEKLAAAADRRDRLENENQNLKDRVEELTLSRKDKEIQAAMIEKRDRTTQADEAIVECEFELMHLKKERMAWKDKLEEKNKLIFNAECRSHASAADKENVAPTVAAARAAVVAAKVKTKAPGKEKATAAGDKNARQLEKWSAKLERMEEIVETKQNLIDAMEKAHSCRAGRIEEMKNEMESLHKKLSSNLFRDGGFFTAEKRLATTTTPAEITEKMKETIFLRNENWKMIKRNIDLEDELDQASIELARKETIVKSHSLEMEKLAKDMNEKIHDSELRTKDRDNLFKSHEETKLKLDALRDNLAQSREVSKISQLESEKLGKESREAQHRLHDAQIGLAKTENELSRARQRQSAYGDEIRRVKTSYEKERIKTAELSDEIVKLRREIDETNSRWRKRLDDETETNRRRGKNDVAKDENDPTESSSATVVEDVTTTTESEADALKRLKSAFRSQAAKSITKTGKPPPPGKSTAYDKKHVARMRDRVLHLKRLNTSLKTEKESLRSQCRELESVLTRVENQSRATESKYETEKETRAQEFRDELERVESESNRFKEREREKQKQHREIAEHCESLKSEVKRLKGVVDEDRTAKEKFAADLDLALERVKSSERECSRKKSLLEEYKTKMKTSTTEKELLAETNRRLDEKLTSSEDSSKNLKKSLDTAKVKLKKITDEELATKDEEIKTLRDRCRLKEKELKKAWESVRESDGNLSELEELAKQEMENLVATSETKLKELRGESMTLADFKNRVVRELLSFAADANEIHFQLFHEATVSTTRRGADAVAGAEAETPPGGPNGNDDDHDMLSVAKETAKQILQLSSNDIDDIMSTLSRDSDSAAADDPWEREDTQAQWAQLKVKSNNWITAIKNALSRDNPDALHGFHYLLKSKLQEIVSCAGKE